jgi:hypothetical protein
MERDVITVPVGFPVAWLAARRAEIQQAVWGRSSPNLSVEVIERTPYGGSS